MRCRRSTFLFALLASALSPSTAEQHVLNNALGTLKRYDITSPDQLKTFSQIIQDNDLDVWHFSPERLDLYFPPNSPEPSLLDHFSHSTSYIDPSPPVQTTKKDSDCVDWNLNSLPNSTFHKTYHPLHEIEDFIFDLAETFPDLVNVVELGHSAEGREMYAIAISNSSIPAKKKQSYVIMGAQHAREWVASAAALYTAHALVADPSESFSIRSLLDHFNVYIVPVPNPDGYVYTWETDRFWYKNRMVTSATAKCLGLDLNRNWGYKWKPRSASGIRGSSKNHKDEPSHHTNPCSHWYPGTRPFQAPEVNNIANFVTSIPNVQIFIDFRSYGQTISSPYSYDCQRVPKDAENQLEAAMGAAHALRKVHGTSFVAGPLCHTLYEAPGNAVDWMYSTAGIRYTYAAHLRDTGTYGFTLPATWIRPVGEETIMMVEYLAKFILLAKKRDH